jgi:hypothetical protein
MPFEVIHFRGSDDILRDKEMERDVQNTLEYLDSVLFGAIHRRELLREALDEMGWRSNRDLAVLAGRRYYYKGVKQRCAIEGSFALYEYILEGLFRLQIGHQRERIDMGILLLTGQRGDRTPYGSTRKLVEEEVQDLYPIIDLPVAIALFDLGKPGESMEEVQIEDQEKGSLEVPAKEEANNGVKTEESQDPASPEIEAAGNQEMGPSIKKSDTPEANPSPNTPPVKKTRLRKKVQPKSSASI